MWWVLILAPFVFGWIGREHPWAIWSFFLGAMMVLATLLINPAAGATLILGMIGLGVFMLLLGALPYLIGFAIGIVIFVLFFKGLEQLLR